MSFNMILLYAATVFTASIIPGPTMLLAFTHGIQHGAKRTVASALGNIAVSLIQALISIAGLGTLLIASETAFQVIKLGGAAYLIYIGFRVLFSSDAAVSNKDIIKAGQKTPLHKMFIQSACVTAGNPKAILFFTAVFPQFINPDAAFLIQFGLLAGVGCSVAFGCFMLYAVFGQKLILLFSKEKAGACINKIIGSIFICMGLFLAGSRLRQ